ncbi:helicase-exonuclease AddAB subunit AddB [Evansella sp. AB-P1]|uniref:helicase-exonuclease AddAB subunit AddB n=1 Tax=Evansella sp. AB-P1 TaxID=3037653 RepID=UPI00241FD9DF|nr:helicase-exonuclease AddAB subunit AddB [Evansella sp. AB-P1]MDG5789670.1 helicase-exonuclease AddAB subunit AddB [Evansella sp. AB-P1]
MSVSFLLGRSGTGKTTKIIKKMIEDTSSDPQGSTIIYLVPDQMTFQSEMQLVRSELQGMTRIQVLSFSRLALRILQETGGIAKYHIQSTGIQMLLRKIVEREKDNFSIFKKATDTNGFIEQLEQMITELKRYDSIEALNEEFEKLNVKDNRRPQEEILKDKLHDIRIIVTQFEQELSNHYVSSEDYLRLLAEQIPLSNYLRKAHIYMDGFHAFTPSELNVIQQLMVHSKEITFSLTIDRSYDENERLNELDLFFETARTYQEISHIAHAAEVELKDPILLKKNYRFKAEALVHLEKFFDVRPTVASNNNDGIEVIAAVHRRSEVEGVAREILHLVRDKSYRYQDIVLYLRNLNEYVELLDTVFEDYDIPIFMDQKRTMLNHPVIELIRSSMEIIQGNWRYEAVFRCFKTDLLFSKDQNVPEMRERVDQLENYVLSYGIQGSRWYEGEPWKYRRIRTSANEKKSGSYKEQQFETEINELRSALVFPIRLLEKGMKKGKSVQQYCEVLYEFLERCDIPKKLENLRDDALNAEELQRSKEHDQVWDAVIDLLDQLVEVSGEEKISFDMFRKVLDTGLESLKFSIIPPAIDQVIVADMEHSRLTNIKCAFILGVNEGVIPATPNEGGMISEEERESLNKQGVALAPSSTIQLLNEMFLLYLSLSTPSNRLYLTYPLADAEGRTLQPSISINRLKDLFPTIEEKLWFSDPTEMTEDEQLSFINGPKKTLSYLTTELQSWKKGYPIPHYWWDVYNWFVSQYSWEKQVKMVLHSLFYKNKGSALPENISSQLYGTEIQTSISRMEQFESCPFAQFANYGLSLKERETYKLEAPDIGTLFHAALKEMAEYLMKSGRDFSQLTKDECHRLAKEIVNELAPNIQRQILLSSNRYHYIKKKLEEVVARASSVLAEQSKASGFSPVGLEVGFGPNEELPPLRFQLDNGHTMELVGRIDRVDRADNGEGLLLRVIDYKSSKKDVHLSDVYYGLSLQMLIYLDVVVSFSERWIGTKASPAGVLYFHVHNPLIQATEMMTLDEIEQELFKQFKMKGLISADPDVARLMDSSIDQGRSTIIPAALKKSGEFYSDSSVISSDDYSSIQSFLRKKVKAIGTSITDGNLDIQPVKTKQHVACTFCSFSSVCQFDSSIETNEYRKLTKLKKDEAIEKIRKEGGAIDEGES